MRLREALEDKPAWVRALIRFYSVSDLRKLEDINVHDLRRTCGSVMAQNGVPIEFISQVLNHSNSKITRVYAGINRDNQRSAG